MPHRVPLALAVLGALIVLAALLLRRDPARTAESGPRWKRRAARAGLALLATLGLGGSCDEQPAPSSPPTGPASPPPALAVSEPPAAQATPAAEPPIPAGPPACAANAGDEVGATAEWKAIEGTWAEASDVASGKKGDYPFDAAGKERLLADLNGAKTRLDCLAGKGIVPGSSAELLKADVDTLIHDVTAKRTKELTAATCYKPMMPHDKQDALARLEARMPQVEKLVQEKTLPQAVLRKVLFSLEKDLAVITGAKETMGQLSPEEAKRAKEVGAAMSQKVEGLKARLSK